MLEHWAKHRETLYTNHTRPGQFIGADTKTPKILGLARLVVVGFETRNVQSIGVPWLLRVRFSCNLYFRFFQCIFPIHLCILKLTVSALFWTVLVSMNQDIL